MGSKKHRNFVIGMGRLGYIDYQIALLEGVLYFTGKTKDEINAILAVRKEELLKEIEEGYYVVSLGGENKLK